MTRKTSKAVGFCQNYPFRMMLIEQAHFEDGPVV